MESILAFDIETIPDIEGIRVIYDLSMDLSNKDVLDFALHKARLKNGNEFMPLHLHKVICISCFMRFYNNEIKLGTIGNVDDDEKSIIYNFFKIIDKYTPTLVSWNGIGFDLPVLHYRCLKYGIKCSKYWQMEKINNDDFKYNNYINRYHLRHIDLMDLLSLYQFQARSSLDDIARLCNFPGKIGMDGSFVLEEYNKGNIVSIRNYCEIDVLNTYLLYLRFDLVRGFISQDEYNNQIEYIYNYLISNSNNIHWIDFCNNWKRNN